MLRFLRFVVGTTEMQAVRDKPTSGAHENESDLVVLEETAQGQRTFAVHRDVLIGLCPVVEAAVTGDFKESAQQEICLPQFRPDDFELFLRLAQAGAFCRYVSQ